MDAGYVKWPKQLKVPRMYVNFYGFPPVSSICNACYPFTTLLIQILHVLQYAFQMPLLPWSLSHSHWKAAFPFCDPPLSLLSHSRTGRWVIPVPSLCWHGPYSQEAVYECLHDGILQESLHWSHLRYILIESKNNLGSLAHTDLTIPGRVVFLIPM